jgi:hypothetical protein
MDPATGVIDSGDAAVIAANGDRIAMTLTGQAASATELVFDMDILGGTGRFDQASGSLAVTAFLGATGGWTSEGTGWISY